MTRTPFLKLLPLLLLSCGRPDGLGGQEGEDFQDTAPTGDGDTDTDTDADADADADTDTDTDGDTDTEDSGTADSDPGDTGDTPDADGTWSGSLVATGGGDTCTGTVTLTVALGVASGSGACTFAGPLVATFPAGLSLSFEGSLVETGTLQGTVTADGAPGSWSATQSGDTLSGTFAVVASDVDLSGRFDATRP